MSVIDLAKYKYTLTLDSSDYKASMKDAEKSAESMKGKLSGMGSALKTSLAVGITAVTAAAGAAATMLTKEVVSAYADFEQLVGGVDTLFGEASQTVQGYAENAFRTAGMTANEYMETVTGFSASLIQSLDGDTVKAAQVADMAITDMSDNANKMGSSMESIQNAYQGFAKQNYTMLDNLKLGYGGTKEEMERLLSDAGKISGIKYDISSFSDVSEAIHVVQTEMGITGTTALEAAETISGSMASMQSAIGNLMTGLGNSDADIGALIDNIVDSFQDVVKNIMPVFENIVAALPSALDGILQAVGDILPPLLDTVSELFGQVLTMILSLLPELIPAAVDAIMTIVGALIDNLPLLITAAVQLVTSLVEGIVSALPELIPAAIDAILTIHETMIDNIDLLIDGAIALIIGLAEGLINALPQLIERIPEIVIKLTDAIINNAGKLAKAAIQLIVTLAKGIVESIPVLIAELPKIIEAVFKYLTIGFAMIWSIGKNIVEGIWEGISGAWTWLTTKLKEWCGSILKAIKGWFGIQSPSRVMRDEVGKYIVQGIAEGITEDMSAEEAAEKKAKNITDAFKNALDKNSLTAESIDLEYNLWDAVFGAFASEEEKLEKKLELINNQMAIQADNIALAEGEYSTFKDTLGETAEETQSAYNKLLKEKIDMAKLMNQVQDVEKEVEEKATAQNTEIQKQKEAYDKYIKENKDLLSSFDVSMAQIEEAASRVSGYNPNATSENGLINTLLKGMDNLKANMLMPSFATPSPIGGSLYRQGEMAFQAVPNMISNAQIPHSQNLAPTEEYHFHGDIVLPDVQTPKQFVSGLKNTVMLRGGNGSRQHR